jgi:hypothetical protein
VRAEVEVRLIDVAPQPCANSNCPDKAFGSNAAAWWGFHYKDLLTDPKPREVLTIYELDATGERNWAKPVYNFKWTPQTDPSNVVHKVIHYPGVPVDHGTVQEKAWPPEERSYRDTAAFWRNRAGAQRG